MQITASMVKELRAQTQAGMMDCKKALTETDGDMAKAVDLLREKGLLKAAKKSGRIAAEGLVALLISEDKKLGSLVEVNSETDFVAKNEEFKHFVSDIAETVLDKKPADIAELDGVKFKDSDQTVLNVLNEKISKIGENLKIRRFAIETSNNGSIVGYVHGGGKIGVLVNLESDADYEDVYTLGKDLAMQIASMSPKYVAREDVDQEYIEHEKSILLAQAVNENEEDVKNGKKAKSETILKGMVEGRLKKELKEVCLLEQAFVKDSEKSVKDVVDAKAKELNKTIKVTSFVRYEVGEGLEKREENFADEVAKQINSEK